MENPNYRTALNLVIQSCVEGRPHHEHILEVGKTPQVLIAVGFLQRPLAIKSKTVDKAHFDHGISKGMLERLYGLIDTPKAVYRSATPHVASSCVVMTYEVRHQGPVIVALHPDQPVGRERVVNLVASIYSKEAPNFEAQWKAKGLLLWEAKN